MEVSIEELIRREFLTEAIELLDANETLFMKLEKQADDAELITGIFRNMHTLKGSSLAAGFEQFGAFAHQVEAVLDELRGGTRRLTPDMIQYFLECNDWMRRSIETLGRDHLARLTEGPSLKATPQKTQKALKAQKTQKAQSKSSDKEAGRAKGIVLICDDEAGIVNLLAEATEEVGFEPLRTHSGPEALEHLRRGLVDIIVTDLRMPEMDGLQFISAARQIDKTVPIILCSGFAQRDHLIQLMKLGAFGFIEKPVDIEHYFLLLHQAHLIRKIRGSVVQMSGLAFKSYVAMSPILEGKQAAIPKEDAEKIKRYLEELSILTNFVLST